MKKYMILAALAALFAASCTKESDRMDVPDPGESAGNTVLRASLPGLETKTAIDGTKVTWTAGDAIAVNGVASAALTEGGATAEFRFDGTLEAPYRAVYPASLYKDAGTVTLPAEWPASTVVPLVGYAASGSEIRFSALVGLVRLELTGDGEALREVVLRSLGGEQVSGDFTIDYAAGTLTGTSSDASGQSVKVVTDATLSSTATVIYIPVPAAAYSAGYQVDVVTSAGDIMRKKVAAKTLAAGDLRKMPALAWKANVGIADAAGLAAFRDAVNAGASTAQWENADGIVTLLDDIDLAGFDEWTPIGDVTSTGNGNNACKLTGNSFSGTFNGGGHTIKNFKAAATIPDGATWGLFGAIENAVVKNLNLEADVTLSAAATADAGVLVGTAYCSTIENVKVSGKLKSTGTATNSRRFAIGGIAGFAYSVYDAVEGLSRDVVIKDCEVTLSAEVSSGSNTANGATAAMYGGIVGFATNIKDDSRIRIENCTNNGTMTLSVGRGSGILATANYGTILKGCTNNADQVNTFVNGRIGNICSLLAAQSGLIDCVNNGNLTTTDASTTTGAFVALLNDNSTYIEGGSNTGTVLGANTSFLGLVCANFSKFDHVSDVVVSGRIGVYKADGDHEMYGVTAENFLEYIGSVSTANLAKVTGLTYVAP